MNVKPVILKTAITDHYLTSVSFTLNNLKKYKDNVKDINKTDYNKLNQLLENETWNDVLNSDNVQQAYESFLLKYTNYIKLATIKIKVNNKYKK